MLSEVQAPSELRSLRCEAAGCACLSCETETLQRKLRAEKQELALYKEKAADLREYIRVREEDQNHTRELVWTEKSKATELENQLQVLEHKIAVVEGTSQYILDDEEDVLPRLPDMVDQIRDDNECTCQPCREKSDTKALERELQHKRRWLRGNGGFSLESERQSIRKQVNCQSRLGRTGSYRHYGAGAFKPVTSHLNSNTPCANENNTSRVDRTAKKPKRPALGR
ncbi:hypothetical protein DOTSEDRAFT_21987 [Dothistroma septosporum NZE10]|uniref:Uncharacterized protein n=1 Tax=Dothistroma septosporum (strain NZE10 / CBS 128990) TaxID=675120 RepID=N1PXY7_DOTSN|nr:hypothetical protein DOTSEDRAFT_21987 [Dothistroma septosporum NZE10]